MQDWLSASSVTDKYRVERVLTTEAILRAKSTSPLCNVGPGQNETDLIFLVSILINFPACGYLIFLNLLLSRAKEPLLVLRKS